MVYLDNHTRKQELYVPMDGVSEEVRNLRYATEGFVDDAISNEAERIDKIYAKKTDIPSLDGYATEEFVEDAVEEVRSEIPTLDGYATEEFVEDAVSEEAKRADETYMKKGELPEDIPSKEYVDNAVKEVEKKIPSTEGLASEKWVNEQGFLKEHQDISGKADKTYVDNEIKRVEELIPSTEGLASETYVDEAVEAEKQRSEDTYMKKGEMPTDVYTKTETDEAIEEAIEGQSFKTINGESIIGEGDIEVTAEVPVATKTTLGTVKGGMYVYPDANGALQTSAERYQTDQLGDLIAYHLDGTLSNGIIYTSGLPDLNDTNTEYIKGVELFDKNMQPIAISTPKVIENTREQRNTLTGAYIKYVGDVKADKNQLGQILVCSFRNGRWYYYCWNWAAVPQIGGNVTLYQLSSNADRDTARAQALASGGFKAIDFSVLDASGDISVTVADKSTPAAQFAQGYNGAVIMYYSAALVKQADSFKTINGESILGEGNIEIEGGGDYLPLSGGTLTGHLTLGGTGETAFKKVEAIRNTNGQANGAAFYVNSDGTAAFFHKAYNGSSATNDGILKFDATGLQYAKGGTRGTTASEFHEVLVDNRVKTINGQSIVGTGNIEIQGGGSSDKIIDGDNYIKADRTFRTAGNPLAGAYKQFRFEAAGFTFTYNESTNEWESDSSAISNLRRIAGGWSMEGDTASESLLTNRITFNGIGVVLTAVESAGKIEGASETGKLASEAYVNDMIGKINDILSTI